MPSTYPSFLTLDADASHSPLADSALDIMITDLLAEYELRHRFRNTGDEAIEAVYTFPLPLDAAFLGMTAILAGDTLTAQVLPARQASRHYDDAIGDGDCAALLEQLEPGLLCVNLGNLMPAETGEIVLRFVAALGVADGVARFSLPLVHRPRYGRYGFDAAAVPSHDFALEHPLQAHIRIRGLLAGCPVQCASAGARFTHAPGETALAVPAAMLDRDFVLRFELSGTPPPRAMLIEDGSDSIALLSLCVPPCADAEAAAQRDICLLLDGSGSMNGDAIDQSRQALLALAEALQPEDRIQAIRFGSSTQALFRRPLRATPTVKNALRQLAPTVNADLGGTDMDAALQQALDALAALEGPAQAKVVILVTDGAVQAGAIQPALERARAERVRLFVVAVGSSAGVGVLTPLAEQTGATLERAVPAEPIDAGVLRQLRRARSAPVQLEIDWGGADARALPLPRCYPGDALTALALCRGQAPRTVSVVVAPDGPGTALDTWLQTGPSRSAAALRAWAGLQAHAHAPAEQQEAMALRYGLITPDTKAVLVKQRADDDKAAGLPKVAPVAHMLPAGVLASAPDMLLRRPLIRIGAIEAQLETPQSRATLNRLMNLDLSMDGPAAAEAEAEAEAEACLMNLYFSMDSPECRAASGIPTPPLERAEVQRRWDETNATPEAERLWTDMSAAQVDSFLDEAHQHALAQALAELLLAGVTRPDFQQLLQAIEPGPAQGQAIDFIGHCLQCWGDWCGKDAARLLRLLLDAGARLVLDDDQEARLAVVLDAGCIGKTPTFI